MNILASPSSKRQGYKKKGAHARSLEDEDAPKGRKKRMNRSGSETHLASDFLGVDPSQQKRQKGKSPFGIFKKGKRDPSPGPQPNRPAQQVECPSVYCVYKYIPACLHVSQC